MTPQKMAIEDVRPGDRIRWCGRWVDVLDRRWTKFNPRRSSLKVTVVGSDVSKRQLNYYEGELVDCERLAETES